MINYKLFCLFFVLFYYSPRNDFPKNRQIINMIKSSASIEIETVLTGLLYKENGRSIAITFWFGPFFSFFYLVICKSFYCYYFSFLFSSKDGAIVFIIPITDSNHLVFSWSQGSVKGDLDGGRTVHVVPECFFMEHGLFQRSASDSLHRREHFKSVLSCRFFKAIKGKA